MRKTALASLLGLAALAGPAMAAPIVSGSLTSPVSPGGTLTTVDIQSAPLGSALPYAGSGFTVSFSASATVANRGIVQGQLANEHAVPVGGTTGGSPPAPLFLTGDFGSSLTADRDASGKYLSTGGGSGSITISFSTAQAALALLWGSVDTDNTLTFFNGATPVGTVQGSDLSGITGVDDNGNQGFGGSSYILVSGFGSGGFTSVVASGGTTSFEFAGVAGSSRPFVVPVPGAAAFLGVGLLGMMALRRRSA